MYFHTNVGMLDSYCEFFMDFMKIKLVLFCATVVGRYNDIFEERNKTKQGELFFLFGQLQNCPHKPGF